MSLIHVFPFPPSTAELIGEARMHLQDSLYLKERDLSGDLGEISEDAFERQSLSGKKRLSGDLEEGSEDTFERQSVLGREISLWRS